MQVRCGKIRYAKSPDFAVTMFFRDYVPNVELCPRNGNWSCFVQTRIGHRKRQPFSIRCRGGIIEECGECENMGNVEM